MDKPKNVVRSPAEQIHTGQTIMIFKTPQKIVDNMNNLYDDLMLKEKLPLYNKNLIGNIKDEYSLYLDDDYYEMENHNFLPDDIHEWIKDRIHEYLQSREISYIGISTASSWINDIKAKEFNPNHIHSGKTGMYGPVQAPHDIGLIGVMTLKVPKDMGKEITNEGVSDSNRNGYTEFVVNTPGRLFTTTLVTIRFDIGTFVVFPYDMMHCAYPHFNENETRRTWNINIDVFF